MQQALPPTQRPQGQERPTYADVAASTSSTATLESLGLLLQQLLEQQRQQQQLAAAALAARCMSGPPGSAPSDCAPVALRASVAATAMQKPHFASPDVPTLDLSPAPARHCLDDVQHPPAGPQSDSPPLPWVVQSLSLFSSPIHAHGSPPSAGRSNDQPLMQFAPTPPPPSTPPPYMRPAPAFSSGSEDTYATPGSLSSMSTVSTLSSASGRAPQSSAPLAPTTLASYFGFQPVAPQPPPPIQPPIQPPLDPFAAANSFFSLTTTTTLSALHPATAVPAGRCSPTSPGMRDIGVGSVGMGKPSGGIAPPTVGGAAPAVGDSDIAWVTGTGSILERLSDMLRAGKST